MKYAIEPRRSAGSVPIYKCLICETVHNSLETLIDHNNGKKHKKNLRSINEPIFEEPNHVQNRSRVPYADMNSQTHISHDEIIENAKVIIQLGEDGALEKLKSLKSLNGVVVLSETCRTKIVKL